MSEPVLERSVLERKERDELQTIARAMGAEPGSRARKADLVDIILSKAGIATEGTVRDRALGTAAAVALSAALFATGLWLAANPVS